MWECKIRSAARPLFSTALLFIYLDIILSRRAFWRASESVLIRRKRRHEYDENDVRVLIVLAAIYLNPHILVVTK